MQAWYKCTGNVSILYVVIDVSMDVDSNGDYFHFLFPFSSLWVLRAHEVPEHRDEEMCTDQGECHVGPNVVGMNSKVRFETFFSVLFFSGLFVIGEFDFCDVFILICSFLEPTTIL